MDQLLYGLNADERIVGVHQQDDHTMRVYFREEGGVRHEDAAFFPFLFLSDPKFLEGFSKKHWLKKLEGELFYQHLCAFEEWPDMWDAIRFILDRYNQDALTKVESYNYLDILHFYSDPVTQYLMQSGRTLFKGMEFASLHRLQLDIETYTAPAFKFSNSSRPTDRIILISLSDSLGWEYLINGKELTEREMLVELVRIIRERDPDVIEGHNIFNFDLPYILKRCEINSVPFAIGRNGAVPQSFNSRTSYAERTFEYTVTEIPGRHIVDTFMLVQSYDMVKRNMESHGLKYAAQYFGIASENRTYIEGSKIAWHWDHDPKPLMDYAMDDVRETRGLSDRLSGSAFYLVQMLPFSYGLVARMGAAAKIEGLIVRDYLRVKHSLPKPSEGFQTTGGYTDIFVSGVIGPIIHADVESLYPSIMIGNGVAPATDVRKVFQELLKSLTTRRLEAKRAMKSAALPEERSRLDAMQSSFKILINSFYGYLGYSRGIFNDYKQADVVTQTGQLLLRNMIAYIEEHGGKVVEVDTDGIFFVPPEGVHGEEREMDFVLAMSATLPEGISVALDGRYQKILSYKMKNYALLGYDGRMTIKGSSLISRSMERFGRVFVKRSIECLLQQNVAILHELYTTTAQNILDHKIDVKDFARTESLKDSLQDYQRDVDSGTRKKSAAYEVAISIGRPIKRGSRVSYYITGSDPNPRGFENCKPASEWNPNFPDENTAFYLRRLDEFAGKFHEFFQPKDFRSVFSPDDLFPFTVQGVTLITRKVTDSERSRPEETPGMDAGPSE
ncbi:MAG: DNA polymerase domain-containing protein [Bacteroidota bacterium]